jgi:hypothetical protein
LGYFSHIIDPNAQVMIFKRHRHRREYSIKKDLIEARFKKVD